MSQRIEQVNELIKRELGQVILREMNFPRNILVTLMEVKTSSDLSIAKIYIRIIPESQHKKVRQILNKNIYQLQQLLNKRLRMRPIPKIEFVEEIKLQKSEKIEEIFDKINVEKQSEI